MQNLYYLWKSISYIFFIHFTVLLLMLYKCLLSTWIIICKCGQTVGILRLYPKVVLFTLSL